MSEAAHELLNESIGGRLLGSRGVRVRVCVGERAVLDLDKRVLRGLGMLERVVTAGRVRVVLGLLLILIVGAAVIGSGLGRLRSQSIGTGCLGKLRLIVLARLRSVKQVQKVRGGVG